MRYCIYCEEAMYSSNESVWINGEIYDCHNKCKYSKKPQSPKKEQTYKVIKFEGKEFRIYEWKYKPFNKFKIPKGFKLAKSSQVHNLIEQKKIVYSGNWEVFFCDNIYLGLSKLYLIECDLYSYYVNLEYSNSDGRVVVVK